MKKIILSLFLIIINFSLLHSQVTIGKVEEPKKKEKRASKPISYDSSRNFEHQENANNYYQYIGLKVYLVPVGNGFFSNYQSCNLWKNVRANSYYTVVDIFYGSRLDSLEKNQGIPPQCVGDFPLMAIRNDSTREVSYCTHSSQLILVPYFVKQKQLYEGKNLVSISQETGKKWKCTQVTLLQKKQFKQMPGGADISVQNEYSAYHIYYVLKNDAGETLYLEMPVDDVHTMVEYVLINNAGNTLNLQTHKIMNEQGLNSLGYITEEVYNKRREESKLKQDSLAAQRAQEEKDRIAKEKKEKEQYCLDCINKFGKTNGELIAQGIVDIGMTTEMCKAAWGIPWDIAKTTTVSGTKEQWFYSWKNNLYFDNGICIKIEN